MRRYQIPQTAYLFYHIDLYRTEHEKELETLGIREILYNPHNIVAIEWAEKLGNLLPKHRLDIEFLVLPSGEHQIDTKEIQ